MTDADDPSASAPTRPVRTAGKTARAEVRADGAVLITSTELSLLPENWTA